jgi:RNA polymerase sigma-70 factor (ECF subfamily)
MTTRYNSRSDAELVTLTLAGERAAFEPLLVRHYASVERLCRRLLGSPVEAQDVAQEAALQAFLGLARLDAPVRFGAWLHAIAANLARMALRRRLV